SRAGSYVHLQSLGSLKAATNGTKNRPSSHGPPNADSARVTFVPRRVAGGVLVTPLCVCVVCVWRGPGCGLAPLFLWGRWWGGAGVGGAGGAAAAGRGAGGGGARAAWGGGRVSPWSRAGACRGCVLPRCA